MICKPQEFIRESYYVAIICGPPGAGKTTLALSSPDPLHLDPDKGLKRIKAYHRRDFIRPTTYEKVWEDLSTPDNLDPYQSIVIDTGGTLLKYMSDYLIRNNKKLGQADGSLTQKGWTALSKEFEKLMDFLTISKQKHVIIVSHAKDQSKNESIKAILDISGGSKTTIWQKADFGGFMKVINNKRYWGVYPCEEYDAKCTQGLSHFCDENGLIKIPDTYTAENNFLANLFQKLDEMLEKEASLIEDYNLLMADIKQFIQAIKDAKGATKVYELLKTEYKDKHIFNSRMETKTLFRQRLTSLGLEYKNGEVQKIDN